MSVRMRHLVLGLAAPFLAAPLLAQGNGPQAPASVVGLANISLSAGVWPRVSGAGWSAGASYEPFVTDHLQLGAGLGYSGATGPYSSQSTGASVSGRYTFGPNPRSAPYLALSVAENGLGTGTLDAGAGWLQFLTARTAIDARFELLRQSRDSRTFTSLVVAPSAFAFGPSDGDHAVPQSAGSFDWSGSASFRLAPTRSYGATVMYAPFITPEFQIGILGNLSHLFAQGIAHSNDSYGARAFVRGYYPAEWMFRPFVSVFAADGGGTNYSTVNNLHGASIGVRHYLSPELALDIQVEHDVYDRAPTPPLSVPSPRPQTVLNAGLQIHMPR